MIHKQASGVLCIIPGHFQHRGCIFLPFVDNDPRTAESLPKVLSLAYDDKRSDDTEANSMTPLDTVLMAVEPAFRRYLSQGIVIRESQGAG
jgi:hypothetical protein